MKKLLGLLAAAGLMLFIAPSLPANAMSLPNVDAAAAAAKTDSGLTEVHWRGHRHRGGWHRGWHRHRGWHHRHW
jgi:hypothetical protein